MQKKEVITILDAVLCDSEADVETAVTLTTTQASRLAEALQYGTAHIRTYCADDEVGSAAFTLTGLEWSIDGTHYATLKTFSAAIDCSAHGEKPLACLNAYEQVSDYRFTKLRLVMGGSAPDGSNKITVTCELVLQIP